MANLTEAKKWLENAIFAQIAYLDFAEGPVDERREVSSESVFAELRSGVV
jgi:hypothetical protein